MRGSDARSGELFSYVDLEARVPSKHPLRVIREIANEALAELDADFAALYSGLGRSSIAPERLLRASLLQAFYTIRSERQLMEQLDYNLLYRWFVGLGVDDAVWDHSTFSKNRDRLLDADVAAKFLAAVLDHRRVRRLLSDEHFSVDGTLIEAWASMKTFRPKDGSGDPPGPGRNGEKDFRGERRRNETHGSTTDPDAKLFRKGNGREARLCFMGHALMENRSGLIVQARLSQATGRAEREAAIAMIERHRAGGASSTRPGERRLTLGADKGYDVAAFVGELRQMHVTPHIARNDAPTKTGRRRRTRIDARTTRHPGYALSQRVRKRIEEAFGWAKTIGGLGKVKQRGLGRVGFRFTFAMAAYNLVRLPRLLAEAG